MAQNDTNDGDGGWVEPRLTEEEAERLDELLSKLREEAQAQFDKQGMSTGPASYESLISNNPRKYLEERYSDGENQQKASR